MSREKPLVETFSHAYEAASPDEKAVLRVWMRDTVLPRKEGRNDLTKSPRSEKDSVAARDQRILAFPLSMGPREVAKMLKAEGWYGAKPRSITSSSASGVSVQWAIRNTSGRKTSPPRYGFNGVTVSAAAIVTAIQ